MKKINIKVLAAILIATAVTAIGAMAICACNHNLANEAEKNSSFFSTVAESVKQDKNNRSAKDSADKTAVRSTTPTATKKVTTAPKQKETQKATVKPTQAPTQKPTQKPTQAPTQKPTQAPTTAPTEAPTTAPTEAPTTATTEAPTTPPTEAPSTAPTEAPTTAPTEEGKSSALQNEIKSTIKNTGATGYKIVKIGGTDKKVLVLTLGSDTKKSYVFYQLNADNLTLLGKLDGAHTTAYTDKTTGRFGLYFHDMTAYHYGTVSVSGGKVIADAKNSGTIGTGEKAPAVPGTTVRFFAATDFSGIAGI